MRRAARRALREGLAERPNEDDVDEAVVRAFRTLLQKDPDEVKRSLRGYASAIAYRRGQDRARKLVRERERIKQTNWQLKVITPTPSDQEDHERRERTLDLLSDCMATLKDNQRNLIEEVVQQQVPLSDWSARRGTSYEAGRKMRIRALKKLKDCLAGQSRGRSTKGET